MEGEVWWIVTNRDIEKGEEITWRYTLYSIKENNGV